MKLEHRFTVPAPVDTVWEVLLDPERVAPCFPGATVTSVSGSEFAGIVKIRIGPISLQYRGSGRFTGTDESAHRTVIEASGTASGGQGTAAAKVQASLTDNGDGTTVTVITDLTVTGRPAQFGRGLIEDVSKKILGQFADCLSRSLRPREEPELAAEPAASAPSPHAPAPQTPAPQTPAPQTPAPQTPAPQTPAPQTPAQEPVQPASGQPAPVQPARVQPTQPRLAPPPVYDEIDLLDAAGGAVAKRAIPALAGLIVLTLVIRRLRSGRKRRRTAKRAAVSAPSSTDEARSGDRLQ